ncbi:hypothetical protein ISN76_03545 [Dyella halodurans]|uniref:Uncharacterized protein n=1 Tax=Dyella halodurans TaxID=1920171 RepID=A0ABV9BX36_9GAMM|nr:hypothetical protein [Dyella halodurans]
MFPAFGEPPRELCDTHLMVAGCTPSVTEKRLEKIARDADLKAEDVVFTDLARDEDPTFVADTLSRLHPCIRHSRLVAVTHIAGNDLGMGIQW